MLSVLFFFLTKKKESEATTCGVLSLDALYTIFWPSRTEKSKIYLFKKTTNETVCLNTQKRSPFLPTYLFNLYTLL